MATVVGVVAYEARANDSDFPCKGCIADADGHSHVESFTCPDYAKCCVCRDQFGDAFICCKIIGAEPCPFKFEEPSKCSAITQ